MAKNTDKCGMEDKYKFYLAFENGLCPDYVTEKFFEFFNHRYNVIPVVYNGADMASIAPPHSVEHLAQCLRVFASYFWWRD